MVGVEGPATISGDKDRQRETEWAKPAVLGARQEPQISRAGSGSFNLVTVDPQDGTIYASRYSAVTGLIKSTDERPLLSKEALLSLTSLLPAPHNPEDHDRDTLLQTAVDGRKGGHRGATKTSGPDDPKSKRRRADGREGTRRSDRSHGPRSGGGVSSGRRKN